LVRGTDVYLLVGSGAEPAPSGTCGSVAGLGNVRNSLLPCVLQNRSYTQYLIASVIRLLFRDV